MKNKIGFTNKMYLGLKTKIGLYEKIGFNEAGRLRKAHGINGKRYDILFMDILAEEFSSVYVGEIMKNRFGDEKK